MINGNILQQEKGWENGGALIEITETAKRSRGVPKDGPRESESPLDSWRVQVSAL